MPEAVNLWPLLGVAMVVLGFALRFNPMLVVVVAGIATGLIAGMPIDKILTEIGSGFVKNRNLPLIYLLPMAIIGLIEYYGLRERAQDWISGIKSATAGRLLIFYLFVREVSSAIGLTSLGGHPKIVRPLLAPMTEGAVIARHGRITDAVRYRIFAMAAATDNVGLFFGEDIFVAFGSIALMFNFLKDNNVETSMLSIAMWGIPTAIAAFVIHAFRLSLLDRQIQKELDSSGASPEAVEAARSAIKTAGAL